MGPYMDGAEVLAQSRAQWSQGRQRLEALPCYVPDSATNWRRQTDGHTQIQFGGCVYDLLFSILYRLSVSWCLMYLRLDWGSIPFQTLQPFYVETTLHRLQKKSNCFSFYQFFYFLSIFLFFIDFFDFFFKIFDFFSIFQFFFKFSIFFQFFNFFSIF